MPTTDGSSTEVLAIVVYRWGIYVDVPDLRRSVGGVLARLLAARL